MRTAFGAVRVGLPYDSRGELSPARKVARSGTFAHGSNFTSSPTPGVGRFESLRPLLASCTGERRSVVAPSGGRSGV